MDSIRTGDSAFEKAHGMPIFDWLEKNPQSKLLVVEMVVPPGNGFSIAKLLDLEMLVNGGCERTEQEFKTLLEASGFTLSRIMATKESICIIEAIRLSY